MPRPTPSTRPPPDVPATTFDAALASLAVRLRADDGPPPATRDGPLGRLAFAAAALAGGPGLRRAVALDRHAPADVLRRLAGDPDDAVRMAVAAHPSTPEDVLRALVREDALAPALAGNPGTPQDVLHGLARHPSADVRARAARHPGVSDAVRAASTWAAGPPEVYLG